MSPLRFNADKVHSQNFSFVLEKAGSVKYEDRPIPELKSPYDVLVNVKWTGICGTLSHLSDIIPTI